MKGFSIITMPRMIPSVIVKVANRMKLIGKLLKKTQLKLPHSQCRIINVTIFDLKTNMSNGSILNVCDDLAASNCLLLLF